MFFLSSRRRHTRFDCDWSSDVCSSDLKEEKEAPAPPGRWSGTPPSSWHDRPRPRSDRLSGELLDDLQAWNDACAADGADAQALQDRGRALAIQVPGELGTDGWEGLDPLDGRMI